MNGRITSDAQTPKGLKKLINLAKDKSILGVESDAANPVVDSEEELEDPLSAEIRQLDSFVISGDLSADARSISAIIDKPGKMDKVIDYDPAKYLVTTFEDYVSRTKIYSGAPSIGVGKEEYWQTAGPKVTEALERVLRSYGIEARTLEEYQVFRRKEVENKRKTDTLKEIRTVVGTIVDRLGKPIEPGMVDTVVFLIANGIETTQSCEGHLDGRGCGAPWVEVAPESLVPDGLSEQDYLSKKMALNQIMEQEVNNLLAEFYASRTIEGDAVLHLSEHRINDKYRIRSRIEPVGLEEFNDLDGVEKVIKMADYRTEFSEFSSFLRRKFYQQP